MNPLVRWCGAMLSNGANGEPSTKRVAYMAFVVGGWLWLSADLVLHHGISADWNFAFGIYAGATGGAYVGGKALERKAALTEGGTTP